jgi:hypothetical protein
VNRLLPVSRRLLAVALAGTSLMTFSAPPASANPPEDVPYIAAGGLPLLGCDGGNGVGGACEKVTGPTTLHIAIHDDVSPNVVAYVDLDVQQVGFICGSGDISIPDGTHIVGVWVGGANTLRSPSCIPGQATAGVVSFTT